MNVKITNRNSIVDILKGLCILLVIFTHYNWTSGELLQYFFPFWVDPAVPIFIIISGYVYSTSYEKHGIKNISECYGYKFVLNKLVRYTVPFLIAYAFEVALLAGCGELTTLNLVINFVDGGFGPGSYYYPIMVQFIFVFPIIYSLVKKFDFSGVLLCFVINGLYEFVKLCYYMSVETYRLLVFRYIFLMSVGCYAYIGKTTPKKITSIASILLGILWLIEIKYLGYQPDIITYWGSTSMLAALWIVPFIYKLLTTPRYTTLKFAPLEFLGKASYNIFLTQMVFYKCYVQYIYFYFQRRLTQLFVCLALNVVIGYVFYIIESKITALISKYLNRQDYFHKSFCRILSAMQAFAKENCPPQ